MMVSYQDLRTIDPIILVWASVYRPDEVCGEVSMIHLLKSAHIALH